MESGNAIHFCELLLISTRIFHGVCAAELVIGDGDAFAGDTINYAATVGHSNFGDHHLHGQAGVLPTAGLAVQRHPAAQRICRLPSAGGLKQLLAS